MVIITASDVIKWQQQGVQDTISKWFADNSGKWINDFLAVNPSFTYQQVAWALGYHANNQIWDLMALPTSDSELALAMQLNQMYKG